MNFEVKTTGVFERQAGRLMKKFPSLKSELGELVAELKQSPAEGAESEQNTYKIRLTTGSDGKGKSGAAKIILHLIHINETIYLLTIYNKSEIENLSDKEIMELIQMI